MPSGRIRHAKRENALDDRVKVEVEVENLKRLSRPDVIEFRCICLSRFVYIKVVFGRKGMEIFRERVIAAIDAEIAQLSKVKKLLNGGLSSRPMANTKRAKRTMSPEGRARIAAAQKARWAKQKRVER